MSSSLLREPQLLISDLAVEISLLISTNLDMLEHVLESNHHQLCDYLQNAQDLHLLCVATEHDGLMGQLLHTSCRIPLALAFITAPLTWLFMPLLLFLALITSPIW